jgi:hypothetical protein
MKQICYYSTLLLFTLLSRATFAQSDSTWKIDPEVFVSGFVEVFYAYDFNRPQGSVRQPFLYNHNRHNEFNVNLGFVKLGLEHKKYRGNFALHAGTYVNDNYAAEPDPLKVIHEAIAGISLNKKNTVWLDAGIMTAHTGFESFTSSENWTMTRCLLTENLPYFSSGAKVSYQPSKQLDLSVHVLNGWQRIQRIEGNSMPSFGTQIKYQASKKMMFNWSTFLGTNDPDSLRRMRYFSNFFANFAIGQRVGIIAGFDLGVQQSSKASSTYNPWWGPVIIGRVSLSEAWKMAIRAEYYHDPTGVMIPTTTINGFQTKGLSLNVDYSPFAAILLRLEGRWMNSKDALFETNGSLSRNNFVLASSISLNFPKTKLK